MALSNAERQARFRRNLKARSSKELTDRVRAVIDDALLVVWLSNARSSHAEFDGMTLLSDLRTSLITKEPTALGVSPVLEFLRSWAKSPELVKRERERVARALAVIETANLVRSSGDL